MSKYERGDILAINDGEENKLYYLVLTKPQDTISEHQKYTLLELLLSQSRRDGEINEGIWRMSRLKHERTNVVEGDTYQWVDKTTLNNNVNNSMAVIGNHIVARYIQVWCGD